MAFQGRISLTEQQPRDPLGMLVRDHFRFTQAGEEFEEFDSSILANANLTADVLQPLLLAFYLPQFHAIRENDLYWGKGFTEWRQLPRGLPRFPGHYQPRIPRDLGCYNLTDLSVLYAQAELAKSAGVGAFAFYYYWLSGRRILHTPVELLLNSALAMPFLIIWANESWTAEWEGSPSTILLQQEYRIEEEDSVLSDIARHLCDRRYVRVGGRPLFIIYKPKDIPNAAATIPRWRESLSRKCGVEPLMFMAQTYGDFDPRAYGLDGALEFPPHNVYDRVPKRVVSDAYSDEFDGTVISYDDVASHSLRHQQTGFPLIKTALPGWDNEARCPNRAVTIEAASPKKYERWLKSLILRAMEQPVMGRPLVAVNAWNEWAEGAYLEPDIYYGSSFLNATARAYAAALNTSTSAPG